MKDLVQAIDKMREVHGLFAPLDLLVPKPLDALFVSVLEQLDVKVIVQPIIQPGRWYLTARAAWPPPVLP